MASSSCGGSPSVQNSSVNQVAEFLRGRKVDENVIKKFVAEKMDVETISICTNEEIRNLGIHALGDVIALKRFATDMCKKDANADRKRSLLEAILHSSSRKKSKIELPPKLSTSNRIKTRKVLLGWLHFSPKKNRYLPVRSSSGGGSRQIDLMLTADAHDVISIAKELFIPGGKSCYGNEADMSFGIANYKHDDMSEITVDGVTQAFTLERYLESSKLTRIRLYLTSKVNTSDNDEEGEPRKSILLPSTESESSLETIKERRMIVKEQEKAYEESLKVDQEKEAKKEQEESENMDILLKDMTDAERKEKLRESRQRRVPSEPISADDGVLIYVRHSSVGVVHRHFRKSEKVTAIYNWIGSLSDVPEHFELIDHTYALMTPSQPVTSISSMLYMNESTSTPSIEEDLNFRGFGLACGTENDTINLSVQADPQCSSQYSLGEADGLPVVESQSLPNDILAIDAIKVPSQLLEDDDGESSDNDELQPVFVSSTNEPLPTFNSDEERGYYFRQVALPHLLGLDKDELSLESKRKAVLRQLQEDGCSARVVNVDRWNIVSNMMVLYSDDEKILDEVVQFQFKDESGADFGGISRDVFSSFWKAMMIPLYLSKRVFQIKNL